MTIRVESKVTKIRATIGAASMQSGIFMVRFNVEVLQPQRTHSDAKEQRKWLEENCVGEFNMGSPHRVGFEKEEDALLFMMTFS